MKDETGLELIAFGMCLANKKLLEKTHPEDFTDDDIRKAVGELKAPRVEGQPEPEMKAVLGLLERLGAEPRKFSSLSEAVQAGVKRWAMVVDRRDRRRLAGRLSMAAVGKTPDEQHKFISETDEFFDRLAQETKRKG